MFIYLADTLVIYASMVRLNTAYLNFEPFIFFGGGEVFIKLITQLKLKLIIIQKRSFSTIKLGTYISKLVWLRQSCPIDLNLGMIITETNRYNVERCLNI